METALGSSRRDLGQDELETDLREALGTGVSGLQETRRVLSIGALDPHVMETETPAVLSTELLALHAMEINAQPALSNGVPGLHAMETGTLLTNASTDPSKATASSTMMCQSQYLTRALQASGCMVSTPS